MYFFENMERDFIESLHKKVVGISHKVYNIKTDLTFMHS